MDEYYKSKNNTKIKNNILINKFRKNNIDVRGVWYPCDLLAMYKKIKNLKFQKSMKFQKNLFVYPLA